MNSQFKSSADRDIEEKIIRVGDAVRAVPFGIPFLDCTMEGLLPDDVIVFGAATGRGKSSMCVDIALNLCRQYKKVYYFALEYANCEVEMRMKYSIISQKYYKDGGKEFVSYQGWRFSKHSCLDAYEDYASRVMSGLTNLYTYYRDSYFDIDTFVELFKNIEKDADVVILDHLGFIEFDSPNENKAVSEIIRKIGNLAQIYKVPVIIISHLRKSTGKKEKTLLPSHEDFMGSSNIIKEATRVVVMASGGIEHTTGHTVTYFKVLKNRFGSDRTEVVGKTLYDTKTNSYIDKVKWGRLDPSEKEFIPFDKGFEPAWLKV